MKHRTIIALICTTSICFTHQSLQAVRSKSILKATAVAALSVLAGSIATDPNPSAALSETGKTFFEGALACSLPVITVYAGQHLGNLYDDVGPGIGSASGFLLGNAGTETLLNRGFINVATNYPPLRSKRKRIAESLGCAAGAVVSVRLKAYASTEL